MIVYKFKKYLSCEKWQGKKICAKKGVKKILFVISCSFVESISSINRIMKLGKQVIIVYALECSVDFHLLLFFFLYIDFMDICILKSI